MVASHRSSSAQFDHPPVRRDQRRLYLVVDNTAEPDIRSAPALPLVGAGAAGSASTPGPIPTVLELRLSIEAAWRRWHQYFNNRLGRYGMVDDIARALPVVVASALIIFGGLVALRLAQGEAGAVSSVNRANSLVQSDGAVSAGFDQRSTIVVSPGDSLWSIATDRFPEHDARRVVDLLVGANGGSVIQAGQQLVVPVELLPAG